MKNLVLYFTGTGNSLEVAKELGKELENCEIKNIIEMDEKENLMDYESIGFIYPCYFFSTPSFILEKTARLKLPQNSYYYGIITSGGQSGNSGYQLKEVLEKQGCSLSYFKNVPMGENYIMMYNGPSDEKAADKLEKAKKNYLMAIAEIKSQKIIKIKPKLKLISKVLNNSYEKKKDTRHLGFKSTESCNGCGVCEKVCKFGNIQIVDDKPVWSDNCKHCVACIQWCPKGAIEFGEKTKGRLRYTNPNIKLSEI